MVDIITTEGPLPADRLGVTLMHEHLQCNLLPEYRETGLLNQDDVIVEELQLFRAAGGSTIVDLTAAELTRGACADPAGRYSGITSTEGDGTARRSAGNVDTVRQLAVDSGVNVILGTGHYRDPYLDSLWIDSHSANEIAEFMIEEIASGIGDSSVRPGIIGEIGADKWYVSAAEERSFRAAARAQLQSGLALSTHAARWPVGSDQLDILESEGVNLGRVIIGHCDSVHIPEYHLDIARRGAFVQFDLMHGRNISEAFIDAEVGMVLNLVRNGYMEHILLSQDVCGTSHLHWGGGEGYDFILAKLVDALKLAGVSEDDVKTILVENPRRALTGK